MFDALFPEGWSTLKKLMWLLLMGGGRKGYWRTVTGNPITFKNAVATPLRQLKVEFSPVQDLHGYDSPWPAGGGKNKAVLDSSYSDTKNGVTVEVLSSGEIWVHGTPDIESGYIQFQLIGTVPSSVNGQTVCISVNEKTTGVGFVVGSGNGNLNMTMSDTVTSKTGTYDAGTNRLAVNVRYDVGNINKKYKFQIELGSTPTSFAPYSNICPISGWDGVDIFLQNAYDPTAQPTISLSFGSTLYSVTLDVLTGVVTVDMAEVDLGTLTWEKMAAGYFRSSYPTPRAKRGTNNVVTTALCDRYKPSTPNGFVSVPYAFSVSNDTTARIVVNDDDYEDAASFKTAMSGVQLVYELATPFTIQLTPQQLSSLAGENVMWADVNGDITLEYMADREVDDVEALSLLLGARYTPAQSPDDVPDAEALSIITGGTR